MDYYEPNYSDEESAARKWAAVLIVVAVVAVMGLQFQHYLSPPKIDPGGNLSLVASATVRNNASAAEMGMWVNPAQYAYYAYITIQPPSCIASITSLEARCASLEARLNKIMVMQPQRIMDDMLGGAVWVNPLPTYSATFTFCGGEKGGK